MTPPSSRTILRCISAAALTLCASVLEISAAGTPEEASLDQPAGAPAPFGATPTLRQVKWQRLDVYAFLHFGPNTFNNTEWGFGSEKVTDFNPTDFDAEQIVTTVKSAGMAGLIITGKHHDGFCLWPSKYTEHCVRNSPWKDGKGDVLRELSDSCRKHGLKFGVYISPWDRNHADFGNPKYVEYFHNQIREVATQYGPLFEMWFDGACGGDGYYGGKGGRHQVDYNTYYGWKEVHRILRENQPDCAIWCGQYTENNRTVFGDCIWGGSEAGDIGYPHWDTMSGDLNRSLTIAEYQSGMKGGDAWCPAEGDVSIRPGWFYHPEQDNQVKTPQQLMEIYLNCVGRGGNLIINLPPDKRGRIHENDAKSLAAFGQLLRETFATDLTKGASPGASNVRGGKADSFGPAKLVDSDRQTYWATDDGVTTGEAVLEFKQPVSFNLIRLREDIRLGQRVENYALDAWDAKARDGAGDWKEISTGQTIGATRLAKCDAQTTTRVRLRITKSLACPAIAEFGLFMTLITTAGAEKRRLFTGMDKGKWKILGESAVEGNCPSKAIDANAATFWDTFGHAVPQTIAVDMGEEISVAGFTCLPRQDRCADGVVDQYAFYLSHDGMDWTLATEGEFANIQANPIEQTVAVNPSKARYFKFVAKHTVKANHANVAEIGILKAE